MEIEHEPVDPEFAFSSLHLFQSEISQQQTTVGKKQQAKGINLIDICIFTLWNEKKKITPLFLVNITCQ